MTEQKIKYIELKPIAREIIFNNTTEWVQFFDKYYRQILDKYYDEHKTFNGLKDVYDYRRVKLNKDGSERKIINPIWLQNDKNREAYKKGMEKLKEKQKQQREETAQKKAELQIKIYELIKDAGLNTEDFNIKVILNGKKFL